MAYRSPHDLIKVSRDEWKDAVRARYQNGIANKNLWIEKMSDGLLCAVAVAINRGQNYVYVASRFINSPTINRVNRCLAPLGFILYVHEPRFCPDSKLQYVWIQPR